MSQSERFCADDADITISSSDGVTFKVHRKHLEVHSDVFADAALANATRPDNAGGEIVKLSETSAVLDLLFQYMYRQPQPDLKSVEFPVFAGLAEAAEKYVVYSALPAVATQMSASVIQYPLQVLDYAARHNHKELANEAARLSIAVPLTKAVSVLAPDTLLKWVVFYDQWHINARTLLSHLIEVYHGKLRAPGRSCEVFRGSHSVHCKPRGSRGHDMLCFCQAHPGSHFEVFMRGWLHDLRDISIPVDSLW
ncbi:hypothetical protein B0H14DRAFT_349951 [Mycena olivaceomarginata]|nr:hypothetical protein B0H14DRAFT_349951 [Mycena olivaceomarginata]